ncbi:MAG: response regulator [Geobacteraceae bacterium]|nr:response regulator [Geobacteraceae bacterium]
MDFDLDIINAINAGDRAKSHSLIKAWAENNSYDKLIDCFIDCQLSNINQCKTSEAEHTRLISAIEQSADVIVITDKLGNIRYANPAFTTSTGYPVGEAIGKNPNILKSGMQDDTYYKGLWETITAGKSWSGRLVNKKKDGSFYIEDAIITPVKGGNGEIESFVAVKRDISEHLKLHEEREVLEAKLIQAQKMEAIGRLAGGIAHDFNNMLNVILGYTEITLNELSGESWIKNNLLEIQNAGKRSADLTRQLLTFSRKQTVEPVVVDLNSLIEENLKMLARMIGEEITINFIPEKTLWKVKVDRSQVNQILANLAINARDAINGTGRITIETSNFVFDAEERMTLDLLPGEYASITFSDTGCGMGPEIAHHIFEPFYTTKDGGKGTGLGLATVYGIIKQNEGAIEVETQPGKGSSFTIYLPAVHESVETGRSEQSARIGTENYETILLVEDEPQILGFIKIILEDAGYLVLGAMSPQEALHLCVNHNGQINLLLTDVVMPEMNGKELFIKINAIRDDIRVLFMSGYTSDIIARNGILEEGTDFIHKPFQVQSLMNKVRAVLDE